MSDKIKVDICMKCNAPLVFSMCLPYKESVCVPCGVGHPMWNDCDQRDMPEKEYDKLREKYAKDISKKSLETCKNGGGECCVCGTKFDCDSCKACEKHEYEYWGKGKTNEN